MIECNFQWILDQLNIVSEIYNLEECSDEMACVGSILFWMSGDRRYMLAQQSTSLAIFLKIIQSLDICNQDFKRASLLRPRVSPHQANKSLNCFVGYGS